MFIYLIVNHMTGKYYVGQHKGNNLKAYLQRKISAAKHKEAEGSILFRSMRKHTNPSVWSIHALRSDIQTKEELDQTEKDFIAFLKATNLEYGYNICRGGEGFTGKHTFESIQKMRDSHVGARGFIGKHTFESIQKMRVAHLGVKRSEESKKKQGQSISGINHYQYGKHLSESTRSKIKETLKNYIPPPETAVARLANLKKGWDMRSTRQPCSINRCKSLAKAHGLCSVHYARKRRYNDPLAGNPLGITGRLPTTKPCSIEGCRKKVKALGMCNKHWQQQYRKS